MLAAGLGAIVGIILALTGAGGAILAVPLLMFAFGWTVTQAGPVALLAVGASAAVGAGLGLRQGIVRYRAAALMAVLGSAVTPLGTWAAHRVPSTPLTLIFAAVLLFVAQKLFRQSRAQLLDLPDPTEKQDDAACKLSEATGRFRWTALCTRTLALAGIVTGLLSGLLGVGGGFILVPALRRSTDLSVNSVVATSLMVVALISISAVATAAVAGHLNIAVALPFAGGAIAAMLLGRLIAGHVAGPRLQQGFAVVAGAVAIGLLAHTLRPTPAAPQLAHEKDVSMNDNFTLPNGKHPTDQHWVSGQIDAKQLAQLKARGIEDVINLRPPAEDPAFDESVAAEELQLRYVEMPVAGMSDLNRTFIAAFDARLKALGDRPVLIHCASGNRVGAAMALRAAWIEGRRSEEALQVGRDYGLTKLEPAVADILDHLESPQG